MAFEIINEPNGALDPRLLNEVTREALRVIRKTNPTRIVFADAYNFANAEELVKLDLPAEDQNLVAEFHMYSPCCSRIRGRVGCPLGCRRRVCCSPGRLLE